MAKKTEPARLQPTTADDLREIAKRLKAAAAEIDTMAKMLDKSGKKSVDIEGHKMLDRGFEAIGKFVANCGRRIRKF